LPSKFFNLLSHNQAKKARQDIPSTTEYTVLSKKNKISYWCVTLFCKTTSIDESGSVNFFPSISAGGECNAGLSEI